MMIESGVETSKYEAPVPKTAALRQAPTTVQLLKGVRGRLRELFAVPSMDV